MYYVTLTAAYELQQKSGAEGDGSEERISCSGGDQETNRAENIPDEVSHRRCAMP